MRIIDKTSNQYDLWVNYEIGFGFHIQYTGGYIKTWQIDFMGFHIYLSWGSIEDLYDQ